MSKQGHGKTIYILGREDNEEDLQDRGLFQSAGEFLYGRSKVSTKDLQKRLEDFLTAMEEIVKGLPARVGEFSLDNISFSAEVSAKGTVSLLGIGGELSGKGGLTFVLKRSGTSR
jgi:hypothetical protein